ncbi:MAG: hypothetical protein ABH873_04805 [Candidatus Firestonebacteria bacterium]
MLCLLLKKYALLVLIIESSLLLNISYPYLDENLPVSSFIEQRSKVSIIKYSNNGDYFSAAYNDGTIRLWDVKKNNSSMSVSAHKSRILYLIFSTDNKYIITSSEDKDIKVWLLPDLQLYKETQIDFIPSYLTSSPDNLTLSVGGNNGDIFCYLISDLKVVKTLPGEGKKITYITYSSTGQHCTSGYEDGTIKVWSAFDKSLSTILAHSESILFLDYVNKDNYLLSAGNDYKVKFWVTKTWKSKEVEWDLPQNGRFFVPSSGKRFLAVGCSDNSIEFLLMPAGVYSDPFRPNISGFTSFCISADDKFILLGGTSGEIKIYRNPILVKQYNAVMDKGNESMLRGKYELAVIKYNEAMSIYPEKEAEEKLKEAQKKKMEKQQNQIENIKNIQQKTKKNIEEMKRK